MPARRISEINNTSVFDLCAVFLTFHRENKLFLSESATGSTKKTLTQSGARIPLVQILLKRAYKWSTHIENTIFSVVEGPENGLNFCHKTEVNIKTSSFYYLKISKAVTW